jgi:hypothetical protein
MVKFRACGKEFEEDTMRNLLLVLIGLLLLVFTGCPVEEEQDNTIEDAENRRPDYEATDETADETADTEAATAAEADSDVEVPGYQEREKADGEEAEADDAMEEEAAPEDESADEEAEDGEDEAEDDDADEAGDDDEDDADEMEGH